MYWWRHFDAAEVAQDFARIRAADFDTVYARLPHLCGVGDKCH